MITCNLKVLGELCACKMQVKVNLFFTMSPAVRQLPVKSLGWTARLLLSVLLTWTSLNYFIQPQQVLLTILQLGSAVRRKPFKTGNRSMAHPQDRGDLNHISNFIS
jgi:hypothetical protein